SAAAGAGSAGALSTSAPQGGAAGALDQPDAGTKADAGNECPCAAPTPTCAAGRCLVRGPTMVKADGFYIDSTEVTRAQYALFLTARAGDTSGQAAECAWNASFDPAFDPSLGTPPPSYPVTDVDYCDAAAFCAWADKRLCGKIGGGELALAELADPSKSQWFAACAGPKAQAYPYGATYQSAACNDKQGAKALLPVGSKTTCQGYYPGLFDMLGNAQEWTAACGAQSGRQDGCETIGGSYLASTVCSQSSLAMRELQDAALGFRCCSQ
ncbi:MAG TPA: SUMF1/EgtB/PvdO family nonheme iron enzyme, partial [Polyangiaceae bacterium]